MLTYFTLDVFLQVFCKFSYFILCSFSVCLLTIFILFAGTRGSDEGAERARTSGSPPLPQRNARGRPSEGTCDCIVLCCAVSAIGIVFCVACWWCCVLCVVAVGGDFLYSLLVVVVACVCLLVVVLLCCVFSHRTIVSNLRLHYYTQVYPSILLYSLHVML